MADEVELEVKIIPDEEANEQSAKTADEKSAKIAADITAEIKDPAVQELMAQYKELEGRQEETERRRVAAENEAARHRTDAESAKKQVTASHLDTVTTAMNAAKADAEQAKRDIRAAKAAEDVDAEIEAQDRLAQARADERRLDEARADLEARAKAPPRREQPTKADPVEAFIGGRSDPSANWLRAHPEFVRDERKRYKLDAAHSDAMGEGLSVDTPAYFAHVETFLGISGNGVDKKTPTEAAQVRPRASAPVAPGGNVASGGNGSSAPVMLTKGEALAAQDGTHTWNYDDPKGKFKKNDPIGIQEFARRKQAMQRQGLYDKTSYEA